MRQAAKFNLRNRWPGRAGNIAGLAVLLVLAACANKRDRAVAFDGIYFKAKTVRLGDDLADFSATINGVSASLDGAREAARYEGTKYCIANYGTSTVDWMLGPDADAAQLTISDDAITFQGRCNP